MELVLSMPKEGYKTSKKAEIEGVEEKTGWTPLIAAIN
jgi:hypothetical protein